VRTIDDYFSSLTRFLEKRKSIVALEPKHPFQRITEEFGRINARLRFFDDSYLDIDEMIRIEHGVAVNYNYRYHYQRQDGPVFTYDDTPHHPELETFPHHKHPYQSGQRRTEAYSKVTLIQIIQEIDERMSK